MTSKEGKDAGRSVADRATKHNKLQRLPKDYKIQKRPILRPAIASKYAGSSTEKVLYVSSKMPFMAAVKRVQKLLTQVEKRDLQSAVSQVKGTSRHKRGGDVPASEQLEKVAAVLAQEKLKNDGQMEKGEVVMKGTGKAIEKTLGLALFFQQRDEYKVTLRTSSVGTIDDIVPKDEGGLEEESTPQNVVEGMDLDGKSSADVEAEELKDIPESRIRYASVLEVFVSLAR